MDLNLSEILRSLTKERLSDLGPGMASAEIRKQLELMTPEIVVSGYRSRDAARACVSGLWLLHDFLDESHTISQALHTPEGSFWHAIMHRREPDAWNSKYWWQRVGNHPVLNQLVEQCPSIGYKYTTPDAFVDFCERVRDTGSGDEILAKKLQWLEWKLLFDWCLELAKG